MGQAILVTVTGALGVLLVCSIMMLPALYRREARRQEETL